MSMQIVTRTYEDLNGKTREYKYEIDYSKYYKYKPVPYMKLKDIKELSYDVIIKLANEYRIRKTKEQNLTIKFLDFYKSQSKEKKEEISNKAKELMKQE